VVFDTHLKTIEYLGKSWRHSTLI